MWQEEMTLLLRAFVNDLDATKYTDDRLEQALVVGAKLVSNELSFSQHFVADVVGVTLTPDPTVDPRDENFINLATVRTACIIDRGAASAAADQAIRVKDGASEVDLRDAFKAKLALLEKGWCAVYEEMRFQYVTNMQGPTVGAVIVSPFRLFAFGPNMSAVTRRPY